MFRFPHFLILLDIIITHKDCLDGHSCAAIQSKISELNNIRSYIVYIHPSDKIGANFIFNYIIWLLSYICILRIIFTDVIPLDICEFIDYYKTRNIKFEIYDHHHTKIQLVTKLQNKQNVLINFNSEQRFGAVLLLIEKYKTILKLTLDQQIFFTCIAAADMWNTKTYPELNFFIFGLNLFLFNNDLKMLTPDIIWDLSLDGSAMLQLLQKDGHKFYSRVEKILNIYIKEYAEQCTKIFKLQELDKLYDYKILLINTSELPPPYCVMDMTSVICYYLTTQVTKYNINTLAIYSNNSEYISLRRCDSNIDVSKLAILAEGGGHQAASGCKLDKFLRIIS